MAKSTNLRVWQHARELLKLISTITADMRAEGDLKSQLRRAVKGGQKRKEAKKGHTHFQATS